MRFRVIRSGLSLLLGTISPLVLIWWLTQPLRFFRKRTFSSERYNGSTRNFSSTRNFTGKSPVDELSMSVQPAGKAPLHLIIQFPVLNTSGSSEHRKLENRQKEYIYCLQRNLLSPHVQEIHNLCESDQDPLFIKALNLSMDWKLVFHFLGRRMRYKDAFDYASKKLLNKISMIIHTDCYVDKGFEYLSDKIPNNKTMYALTRHETAENIRLCVVSDFCGPNAKYIGSHDAFLFRLRAPVSPQLLGEIDYRPNILGIEQVLMFYLRKYGGFQIKNPCKILHIVHHHCSGMRNGEDQLIKGQRIDHYLGLTSSSQGKMVLAPFSDL